MSGRWALAAGVCPGRRAAIGLEGGPYATLAYLIRARVRAEPGDRARALDDLARARELAVADGDAYTIRLIEANSPSIER